MIKQKTCRDLFIFMWHFYHGPLQQALKHNNSHIDKPELFKSYLPLLKAAVNQPWNMAPIFLKSYVHIRHVNLPFLTAFHLISFAEKIAQGEFVKRPYNEPDVQLIFTDVSSAATRGSTPRVRRREEGNDAQESQLMIDSRWKEFVQWANL